MAMLAAERSGLLLIDLQTRLVPALADGASMLDNARRLLAGAAALGVPALFTEQNPRGLGETVAELPRRDWPVVTKSSFDATRADGFASDLPDRPDIVVAGCEAHVCVLQSVLGLLALGRRVFVARDAVGSRRPESREAGLARMERHGAEIVTTEMVLFEWLGDAGHPRFRELMALIK